MKIIMLVGLPGSGKTTLGNIMMSRAGLSSPDFIFLDDITIFGGLASLEEAISFGWNNIIVADVFLCRTSDRTKAVQWLKKNAVGYEVELVYFENAPEKCRANVLRRTAGGDHRKVNDLIADLAKSYIIPEDVVAIAVWS
jgi:hypothetical protein